jgi:YbbR domain-containing protein
MKKKIVTITLITIFSIFLWGSVSLSGDYFTTEVIPLSFELTSNNKAIGLVSDDQLVVSVKGQGWQLTQITFGSSPELKIPVNDKLGRQNISVRNIIEKAGIIGSNLQVVEINPETIEVLVERKIEKELPITPNLKIEFEEGYGLVSKVEINPDTVIVMGAESRIEELSEVLTKPIELTSVDKPVETFITLDKYEFINYSINSTKIFFDVQKIVDKEITDIVVEPRNIPPSRELIFFPSRISISVRGGINQLGKLKNDQIKAYITYRQAVDDTLGSLQPTIELPDGVQLINKKPNRLQYIIKQL